MPTFFRRQTPRGVGSKRPRRFFISSPIATTVGSAAGTSSALAVGVAIIAAVGTTGGTATVNGIISGLITGIGAAAGSASGDAVGSGFRVAIGAAAGSSDVHGIAELRQVTSTNILQKPVDCVMAGDQKEFKSGRAHRRALRGIFRE